ncbi:MAG: ATPase, T2SS/T4P/T4SS family [Armatimonadota bacterium]|nr:ATPase, T2SS/T4P/T4SS family [Armatimonadota bacterium]MDR7449949.1 ATPase, T2SS/T4P/T4SS family [Armatimonadota bacterium]MDR7460284.1 ATPase, T2SS/T4P/T4SS family [Armatimonadota bacterium]MDR7480772.1 ATPase, T2SS/T4P/T4SS family [Armatimonadota bacterium]MDR7488934.1 ATPase, T2SS/T4P/T4SS family [Armatimonadota bacterium]
MAQNTLQRRILAHFDDHRADAEEVTAHLLAGQLGAPVEEVAAELETLARLGNLTRKAGPEGEVRYSAGPRRRLLGAMLVEAGILTPHQLQEALAEQAQTGDRLGRILLERGYVSKQTLGQFLEAQRGIPYVNLPAYPIDEGLVRRLPEWVVIQHKVLPLGRAGGEIHLAMLDPTDVVAMDIVGRLLRGRVRPFLITERDFDWALSRFFDVDRRVGESLPGLPVGEGEGDAARPVAVADVADEAPVVRVLNSIILDALRSGATDVHIEPDVERARVRFRIDGVLYDKTLLPRGAAAAVISRLKVLAGMDISERTRPQDGRIVLSVEGREVDLRVATVGTAFGERVAVRLLSTRTVLLGLGRLGLFLEQQELLQALLQRPHGMLLVTGPTGSGKTTTLYAALSHLNQRTRNIMTIEDPVEYRLPGIAQIPVREKAGITFGVGLRAILRQDPDIVMVGEIRDAETAAIAVQAALTGHLVLSTLHTSSAAGALVRLMEMRIEPYLLTSSVIAVLGQRLVRILCSACRRRTRAREAELRLLDLPPDRRVTLYRPVGCPECGGIGYHGRTGVFEILVLNDTIREMVLERRPARAIQAAAREAEMLSLRQAAVRKVLEGVTSLEELQRLVLAEVE